MFVVNRTWSIQRHEFMYCVDMTSPADLRAQIASAVRATREERGLSASALAEATGGVVTRDTIANLESGRKRVIDVAELIVLAKALDVSPLSLIYPPST